MSALNVTAFPALSGGLPVKQDETPSIVFCAAYCVLLLPTVWRTFTYRHPGKLLLTYLRLCLFVLVRIATFGLRAEEGATATLLNPVPDMNIFIAEQILLGIGFIVLVDLLLELIKAHIFRSDVPNPTHFAGKGEKGSMLQTIVRLMHIALVIAIVLGISAGTKYGQAMNSSSIASQVKTMRLASTIITLSVSVLCLVISLLLIVNNPSLGAGRSFYLAVTAVIMAVVPAYRLWSTLEPANSLADLVSDSTRLKFYILQGLMEFLVATALILVDVRVWFFAGGEEAQMALGKYRPPPDQNQYPMAPPQGAYGPQYGPQYGQQQYGRNYA